MIHIDTILQITPVCPTQNHPGRVLSLETPRQTQLLMGTSGLNPARAPNRKLCHGGLWTCNLNIKSPTFLLQVGKLFEKLKILIPPGTKWGKKLNSAPLSICFRSYRICGCHWRHVPFM